MYTSTGAGATTADVARGTGGFEAGATTFDVGSEAGEVAAGVVDGTGVVVRAVDVVVGCDGVGSEVFSFSPPHAPTSTSRPTIPPVIQSRFVRFFGAGAAATGPRRPWDD
ncbi:hypothetical protein RHCRD62_60223 [Rhodococcus sp. RD6.2]|nr:hypothetical protein RHCRD62_60223 [Rhodococcus sp. RD6.2]